MTQEPQYKKCSSYPICTLHKCECLETHLFLETTYKIMEERKALQETKFKVGDKAWKPKGYKFPCTIVSVFTTVKGDVRVVAEMDEYGLLHIFNENQLEHYDQEDIRVTSQTSALSLEETFSGYTLGAILIMQKMCNIEEVKFIADDENTGKKIIIKAEDLFKILKNEQ